MNLLDLEAIEARAARPVVTSPTGSGPFITFSRPGDVVQLLGIDLPALIAEVRKLHAERESLLFRLHTLQKAQSDLSASARASTVRLMESADALRAVLRRVSELAEEWRARANAAPYAADAPRLREFATELHDVLIGQDPTR